MKRLCALLLVAACGSSAPAPVTPVEPPLTNEVAKPTPQKLDIDSIDILARSETASFVLVKHVLFGWAELADVYAGNMDPRAAKRTQAEAAKLAEDVAAQLRTNPRALDELITKHSEDPGSLSHEPYEMKPDSRFVPEFQNLGMRLAIDEVGIVKTRFGYHVMVRVAPPPLDPLESADILARTTPAATVDVLYILIGWEGLDATMDAIGKPRTKAEADVLVTQTLDRIRAGTDMLALIRTYSDDRDTNRKAITVATDTSMIEPFKNLALRLNENEVGVVKTRFGFHIVKRIPPPPPDPLESVAIMNRTKTAERVKVKHILLGWKEVNADDPRGKTRSRADLEKLVKATLKKLAKKGANFEKLMDELSEDPGSAKSGEAYEATPDTGLVKPFLNMSLRLEVNEIGVVKTDFGIHIIKRVE